MGYEIEMSFDLRKQKNITNLLNGTIELVMAGLSIYLMIDGEIYIQSANSDVQVASFIPEQPININLGAYTVTPDEAAHLHL